MHTSYSQPHNDDPLAFYHVEMVMLPDKIMETTPTVASSAWRARVRLGVSLQKIHKWTKVGTMSPRGMLPICFVLFVWMVNVRVRISHRFDSIRFRCRYRLDRPIHTEL